MSSVIICSFSFNIFSVTTFSDLHHSNIIIKMSSITQQVHFHAALRNSPLNKAVGDAVCDY